VATDVSVTVPADTAYPDLTEHWMCRSVRESEETARHPSDKTAAMLATMLDSVPERVRALSFVARRVPLTGSVKSARRFGQLQGKSDMAERRRPGPAPWRLNLTCLPAPSLAGIAWTASCRYLAEPSFGRSTT
jgi:hypothetical protein